MDYLKLGTENRTAWRLDAVQAADHFDTARKPRPYMDGMDSNGCRESRFPMTVFSARSSGNFKKLLAR